MTDRKLSVIQVATMNNGGSIAVDADGFGLFHEHDNMGQFEMGFVLYEPAVGRCATCSHFEDAPNPRSKCCGLRGVHVHPIWRDWIVPADGSGYCHEHVEKKNA